MPNKRPRRELAPDVFDTIELMAVAFGGIGGGSDFTYLDIDEDPNCPICVYGMARASDLCTSSGKPIPSYRRTLDDNESEIAFALSAAGISRITNDNAVAAINIRLGRNAQDRVTFKRWCKKLDVVRGETPNVELQEAA